MSNQVPFKLYKLRNKGDQPSYVYLGKPVVGDSPETSFYPHQATEAGSCSEVHLFSCLIGSRNVKLTPLKITQSEVSDSGETEIDPFVYIDSRWYNFWEYGVDNSNNPTNLTPTNLLKTFNSSTNGDYVVEWRTLTSDGSVFIKPSRTSTLFWTGSEWITDKEASFGFGPDQPLENVTYADIDDDLVWMKTRRHIDLVRADQDIDKSVTPIYRRYVDECLWKSTYLLKRFRGSQFITVQDLGKKIKISANECACASCSQYINENVEKHYSRLLEMKQRMEQDYADFRNTDEVYIGFDKAFPRDTYYIELGEWYDSETDTYASLTIEDKTINGFTLKSDIPFDGAVFWRAILPNDRFVNSIERFRGCLRFFYEEDQAGRHIMDWIEMFEYNVFHSICYNGVRDTVNKYGDSRIVYDPKTVEVQFSQRAYFQNEWYGIDPSGTRLHHKMPPVEPTQTSPYSFSYKITHRVQHDDMTINGKVYPRFATQSTSEITGGKISDGQNRVVVPPGVAFRTYKAIPGVHQLSMKDVITRRPDEFHFAVDNWGNILGEYTLPFPAVMRLRTPILPWGYDEPHSVSDILIKTWESELWSHYFNNGKSDFFDEDTLYLLQEARVANKEYVLPGPCNGPAAYCNNIASSSSRSSASSTSSFSSESSESSKASSSSSSVSSSSSHSSSSVSSSSDSSSSSSYYPDPETENQLDCCGTFLYLNIHSCPIWIDEDIFCEYLDGKTKMVDSCIINEADVPFPSCSSISSVSSTSSESSESSSNSSLSSSQSSSSAKVWSELDTISITVTPEQNGVNTQTAVKYFNQKAGDGESLETDYVSFVDNDPVFGDSYVIDAGSAILDNGTNNTLTVFFYYGWETPVGDRTMEIRVDGPVNTITDDFLTLGVIPEGESPVTHPNRKLQKIIIDLATQEVSWG